MTILKVQRSCLKKYTPAKLPEEKRAILRRSKTRRENGMSANMAEPSVESYGRSKYKLLREAQGAKKNASKNDASEQIKRIPWHLKSDWKNCIYLLQRILFHVTPRIAAVKTQQLLKPRKLPDLLDACLEQVVRLRSKCLGLSV